MRILYGITKSNWGGAQRYVFDMALEAKKLGHEVTVLCGGEGSLVEKLNSAGIRVVSLPYLFRDISLLEDIRAFFFILKTLRKERPDVFHINSSKMGGVGALAGRLARTKKIIFTAHSWAFSENRPWVSRLIIKFLSWLIVILSHKTIAVSEAVKDKMGWPLTKKKVLIIKNGIRDFNLLDRDDARAKLGLVGNEVVVGTISELHHIKGLDFLLKAWAEVESGKLIIVGGGEEEKSLKSLTQDLKLGERVVFKGFVDEARTLLKGFDIFTLTSRSEGLPYAILEAGMARLPIVASRTGGIPEVVEDGSSGALVEIGNIDEIREKLQDLINNTDKRVLYGESLYNKILQEFSLDKMVHDTLEVYV